MLQICDFSVIYCFFFFFSSRRRHTRSDRDWSSDVCSSDLPIATTSIPTPTTMLPLLSMVPCREARESSARGGDDGDDRHHDPQRNLDRRRGDPTQQRAPAGADRRSRRASRRILEEHGARETAEDRADHAAHDGDGDADDSPHEAAEQGAPPGARRPPVTAGGAATEPPLAK